MARIKKYGTTYNQPLSAYGTFILDTEVNSKYFKISEFKNVFTGGKNGFLIEGSKHLLESTELKVQVLDVEGNPLYVEYGNGIPEYYEGTSKVVAVYVYEDTPIGEATVTILGELKTYEDTGGVTLDIPDDWKGNYNVKWSKTFSLNRLLSNEDKVRFYRRPVINITEIIKPVFSTTFATVTKKGFVKGTPIVPIEGVSISDFKLPTSYKLTTIDNTAWTGSMVGSAIELTDLGYTGTISDVINKKELLVTQPYAENGLVTSFINQRYTASFNYLEGISNIATALTGSFAKINITDLTTFVGDVNRVKIFRKSQSQIGDYQFIQEIKLESNELLVDLESQTTNLDYYGIFTSDVIKDYWVTSSNSLTATFNQNYLYDSVKLSSNTSKYFHTSKSLSTTEGKEYTLSFNIRVSGSIDSSNYVRAFLSGSKESTNGIVQVEQDITTITSQNSLLQKTTSTDNIEAEQMDNPQLYFEVVGNNWYIANVSFTSAQETAFSPDEITFIQSVPRSLPVETFDYRFEFYDINNNYVPVLVEQTKTFNGGNLQNLQKGLVFSPRTLIFQFDSGSNPVPPTVVGFTVTKNLLTGSVTYTSQSFDFDGNELSASYYTASFTGRRFPGLLSDITSDAPLMTVGNFTGSREDKLVQIVKITGEVEGYTDTVIFTKVLDGFGGVNHLIRPYRGTDIRNSSTQSLEIQAIRIDGVNDIELSSLTYPTKGWPTVQLHVLSASADKEYFINIQKAVAQNFIQGVSVGELGSKELNYNAVFNRDSIDKRRTIYLIKSGSITDQPAYIASASILSSIVLSDLQDGLDSGFVSYDTDVFNINFRNDINFSPVTASVTASFYVRGTNMEPLTASLTVFPSMSINKDFVPEYWVYYVTHSSTWNNDITIVASDDNNFRINSGGPNSFYGSYVRSPLSQSKTLTTTFKYTEPYTLTEVTIDKTFTIVPAGKPGDESIVFEIVPQNISLKSNAKGEVNSYQPSITDIRLKQGSRYLLFTGSISQSGTFHIAQNSITSSNITGGLVYFDNNYTSSLIVSASSGLVNLSGSITYPLIIHPYYTSSIYTQSIVQNYAKIMDGPPPLQVIISPVAVNFKADEVGYISDYTAGDTTIQVKDGEDFLRFTSTESFANAEAAKGTFKINNGASVVPSNIQVASIGIGSNINNGLVKFNRFDYPYVSASAVYNIVAFPYSLGPGHIYTSSILTRTQTFTKNVPAAGTRNVTLAASSQTVNFDGDGVVLSPTDPIILTATSFGTTGSNWFQFYKDDIDYTGIIGSDSVGGTIATVEIGGGDATAPGENATWEVRLRDGNNSPSAPVKATNSLTISGIKAGGQAYNIYLTNPASSIVYTTQGTIQFEGTGTRVIATKGDTPLLHKSTFSAQTTDQFGNDIGSIGEYRVKLYSKSSHIHLSSSLIADLSPGDTLPTVNNEAKLGYGNPNIGITSWDYPETNLNAEIVYEIDIENGRQILYKTQSIAVQLEGKNGPGIVFRGPWSNAVDYIFDPSISRRDAVLYPDNSGTYYASLSGSGPTALDGNGNNIGYQQPDTSPDYWQSLGQEEFFVAAKIAIFEESFVKNTLNVGTNLSGSNANIIINGRGTRPYIAVGQGNALAIGYGQEGIWMGTYYDGAVNTPRFSLTNGFGSGPNQKYLRWNGSSLEIKGDIIVTGGDAATQTGVTGSANAAVATAGVNTTTALTAFSASLGAMAAINQIQAGQPITYIGAGVIVTNMIATNAIMSTNFGSGSFGPAQPYTNTGVYSAQGSFFNLSNGKITSKAFAVTEDGDAFFKGNLSGASGTFTGTVSVGSGVNTITLGSGELSGPGFLLNSSGLLVSNATISGTINASGGSIGSWTVDANQNLRDGSSRIFLNPNLPGVEIKESGTTRLKLAYGSLTDLSGTGFNLAAATVVYSDTIVTAGVVNIDDESVGETFTALAGTYTDSTVSFPGQSFVIDATNAYGNIDIEWGIRIYDSSGTVLINEQIIAYDNWTGGGGQTSGQFIAIPGSALTITAPTAGNNTYIYKAFFRAEGNIGSAGTFGVDIYANLTIPALSLSTNINIVELTNDGMQVATSANRYVKLKREDSSAAPIIDGMGFMRLYNDTSNATIRLYPPTTGTSAGGMTFETNAGSLTMGTNNITLNGNGSTTNGIINVNFGTGYVLKLGGQSNEAIIISNAWPNQATNVATARLRPITKLGLSGRELIFDSSTIRVKKDVEDYPENAYEIIKNIKPVLYWPRAKRDSEDLEDYNSEYVGKLGGFIAEWLDAEPELRRYVAYETTEENPMDPTAIAYDKIVVPLTKAVQILMERVERLESIISGSNN